MGEWLKVDTSSKETDRSITLLAFSCDNGHITSSHLFSNLVVSHPRLSFQILADFIRFGHGMTDGILVLDGTWRG